MSAELSAALNGALLALIGVVTATFAVLAVHVPRLVQAYLESRTAQTRATTEQTATQRDQRMQSAADRAVLAAEEEGRAKGLRGDQKLSIATEAAQRFAPDAPPPAAAIQASVARLRTSTSSSQLQPVQLPIGTALSIPVQVVSSSNPPAASDSLVPLPRPAPLPRDEMPTQPDRSRR
jgi:hypothetical protein